MEDWTKAELLQAAAIAATIVSAAIGGLAVYMVRTVHILLNGRLTKLLAAVKDDNADAQATKKEKAGR